MVLLSKLENLKVVKFHKLQYTYASADYFKFMLKGFKYMEENGRSLAKIQFKGLLTGVANQSEHFYNILKTQPNLIVVDLSHNTIGLPEAKAVGKILADFKDIRELNLSSCNLSVDKTKLIADGLMRAKRLEIIKLRGNTSMGIGLNNIIYNLAFSPKIRHIDISDVNKTDTNTAEALYKLLKISGAIEVLILKNSGV